jgi:hypothetical protein
VIGSLSGVPIYDNIYTLSATGHTLLNFNYHGIDSVEFSIFSGGTHHQGYDAFDGAQVAFDNLTISVPDSGSTVMLFGIGVCALGFLRKKLAWIDRLAGAVNRRFKFDKSSQLSIRTHNKTLSVAAMSVSNPDGSPVGINGWDITQAPTGFLEIVSDWFPRTFSVFWCRQDAGSCLISFMRVSSFAWEIESRSGFTNR